MNKQEEKKFMEKIKRAGDSENYETSWDEKGLPTSKKKTEIKKGKISKSRGARFELKVRRNLEEKGRYVDKWNNNVDLEENKLIIAKKKYNPFKKAMTLGTGFPDFIAFKKIYGGTYSIIGVESKINGTLSKIEKEKCKWYLENEVFSEIWIAKQKKVGRKSEVEYVDFREKYMK